MEIPESHSLQLWSWPSQIYLATKVNQEKFSLCCIHDSLFRPASGGRNLTKCVAPAECKQRILRQTGFLMSQSIVCCLWRDPSIALVDAVLVHHSLCAANHGCHIYSTLLTGKITYFDYVMPHLQPLLIGKITHVDYFMPTIKKFEASFSAVDASCSCRTPRGLWTMTGHMLSTRGARRRSRGRRPRESR